MLINLSNHPSAAWSPEQKAEYKDIIDLPFPVVDPAGDGEYIDNPLAELVSLNEELTTTKQLAHRKK